MPVVFQDEVEGWAYIQSVPFMLPSKIEVSAFLANVAPNQFTFVLGHEMGHQIGAYGMSHGTIRGLLNYLTSTFWLLSFAGACTALYLAAVPASSNKIAIASSVLLVASVGSLWALGSFAMRHELAADAIGIRIMVENGLKLEQARTEGIELMNQFSDDGAWWHGAKAHPEGAVRIQRISELR